MFVSGVYNGEGSDSHRAAVPSTCSFVVSATEPATDFNRTYQLNVGAGWSSCCQAAVCGTVIGHISEVTLRRAGLVLRWVTVHGFTTFTAMQPGHLSLVIPPWVGEMSTSDGYGYR